MRAVSSGIEAQAGPVRVRVTALTDSIVRVRVGRGGLPEDASWAVPASVRGRSIEVRSSPGGFETGTLHVQLDPRTLALTVSDLQGHLIHADNGEPITFRGNGFALHKKLPLGEHYFGLGDKTGPYDRRGASYVNWNTDAYGYGASTDPIYKSIPSFIAIGGPGGAYGLFLDNSWRSWFDFGHRRENLVEIGADDGPIDYYLIAGPTVADVVRRYTDLTGKPPLPPRWALGFQQSRYSYMSDAELRDIAKRLRSDRVPADVLWLDIDYQDRNRPFTVNRQAFPDMKQLASDMAADGFKLVAITDLHIAHAPGEGYVPYDSGAAGDHFLKNPDGTTYVAPVWPGPSVFPDFTHAATRRWWGDLYKGFVADGIAGFWNDMNEPAVSDTPSKTMPQGTLHRIDTNGFEPRNATHAEIHNVYGLENSRATYEGLLRLRPNQRPFVITRASYAGGQRYAATWTGDNSSSWDHLKLMVQQLVNLGLSGFSWTGADIGGFTGGPGAEQLTRWYQIGAFTPVFRSHAGKGSPRAEPWVDGPEHLAIRRRFIEERYRLLPYFYAVAEQNSRTGDPVMRPTFYDYPGMLSAPCDQSMAFTVGRDLLVAPSPKPESPQPYDICLPSGGWYDYWTGTRVDSSKVSETPRIDRLPLFVRPGAILPRQPVTQSTSEQPKGALELHVYPGPDCRGDLYWDDGLSVRGDSLRQAIRCETTGDGVRLIFEPRQGRFRPWWKEIAVTVHGGSGNPESRVIPEQPRGGAVTIPRR